MTKKEREIIKRVQSFLDAAFDPKTMEHRIRADDVLHVHRLINELLANKEGLGLGVSNG